jgi:hypothetical protein
VFVLSGSGDACGELPIHFDDHVELDDAADATDFIAVFIAVFVVVGSGDACGEGDANRSTIVNAGTDDADDASDFTAVFNIVGVASERATCPGFWYDDDDDDDDDDSDDVGILVSRCAATVVDSDFAGSGFAFI